MARRALLMANGDCSIGYMTPELHCPVTVFVMERVMGFEPALSAWELSEHMGVLGSLRVSRSRAARSVPWRHAVMAREWHDETSVVPRPTSLLANSQLHRCLVSLNTCAAQLVGLVHGWCWDRCRTFLEYGPLRLALTADAAVLAAEHERAAPAPVRRHVLSIAAAHS